MKKNIVWLAAVMASALCLTGPAQGAMYIKFDGVDGESKDVHHKDWIDLLSYSWGLHKSGAGATGGARREEVGLEEVVLSKAIDKASPKLAEALCTGRVFPTVTLHFTKVAPAGNRVTYLVYEMKNVMVSSVHMSCTGDTLPLEEVSFNFQEIHMSYTTVPDMEDPTTPPEVVEFQTSLTGKKK